jgi:cyanophycinase
MGGKRIDGIEVCGQECAGDLDEVDVQDASGLAPFAVDVHAPRSSR